MQEIRNPFSQSAHCWTDSELQMPPQSDCHVFKNCAGCVSASIRALGFIPLLCVSWGGPGRTRQRQAPTFWGNPAQRVLELSWLPGGLGHAFTITLTHSWLTSSKGCDFFQSDLHGSIDFGRERWFTRGTGHLELGQVISGDSCGADASIQPWCQFVSFTGFHFLVPSFWVTHFLYNLLCLWKTLVYLKYFYWFISLTVI